MESKPNTGRKGCGQIAIELAIVAVSPWLLYEVWQDAETGWTYLIAYLMLASGALYSLLTGAVWPSRWNSAGSQVPFD